MDTGRFIAHVISEDIYGDLAVNRLLLIGKTKKKIRLMKNELVGKIMKNFVTLRPRMNSYLMDEDIVDKKAKVIKKCVIK